MIPDWTASQRAVLLAALASLLAYLSIRSWMHPRYIDDPLPVEAPRAAELVDRIDPNRADEPTLAALPIIGRSSARRIIAYREQFAAEHPGELAFHKPSDLMNVQGIGPASSETMSEYLQFPTTATSEDEGDQRN
jgi:hypothetical protein